MYMPVSCQSGWCWLPLCRLAFVGVEWLSPRVPDAPAAISRQPCCHGFSVRADVKSAARCQRVPCTACGSGGSGCRRCQDAGCRRNDSRSQAPSSRCRSAPSRCAKSGRNRTRDFPCVSSPSCGPSCLDWWCEFENCPRHGLGTRRRRIARILPGTDAHYKQHRYCNGMQC